MSSSVSPTSVAQTRMSPQVYERGDHIISRSNIDDRALKVLYRLRNAGYKAYLVGGGVRDLLLGREPKDFDVATDALPEQVRELFRNCRLIGRRFRLAHVHFGKEVIEVATFRAQHEVDTAGDAVTEEGRILRDNVYGDIDDDVWRRDFTVNALYYNIDNFTLIDYVGGMEDVRAGRLRVIGDPEVRFREDPVRMLRAIRFAVKLGFTIHSETEAAILALGRLLTDIPAARLFEELLKLFLGGTAVQTFELLRHYGLFQYLFPDVDRALSEEEQGFPHMLLVRALENTDLRIAQNKPVTPAFLFAALLWDPLRRLQREFETQGRHEIESLEMAADATIAKQVAHIAMPRRFSRVTREIWALQPRLMNRTGKRPQRLLEHPRFRAAYDFLVLRAEAGEDLQELADWWTKFQELDAEQRPEMQKAVSRSARPRRRRR
jgi:poly(A) polymerase